MSSKPCVIVSNHQSSLDVIGMGTFCYRPQTKFGARKYFHRCLFVCPQRGGGLPDRDPPRTETSPGQKSPLYGKERVVRILLECIFTARKRSLRRLCFYRCLSVHMGGRAWFYSGGHAWFYLGGHVVLFGRGVCMVLFGGCAWFYSGGMHGFIRGTCMVLFGGACVVLFWGHAWFYSGGMCGFIRGHVWFYSGCMCGFIWGACMVLFGGVCVVFLWGACVVFSVFSDTMRYGQWAGRTHPTGMHSCCFT